MAIRLRENPYREIFEIAQEGICALDASDQIDLANRRMGELLGCSTEDLIGRSVFDFIDERDGDAIRETLERGRHGAREKYDLRLRRGDGGVIWANVSACPIIVEGGYVGALCLMSDLTARKQSQEDLRRSEERFDLAAKATSDVFYEADLITQRLWFSEGMYETFGHAVRETQLEWWLERIHPDDFAEISRVRREIQEGKGEGRPAHYRFRRADGTWADVIAHGYAIRNEEGQVIRMIGAMTDISEKKAAQAAMVRSQERLQALFANALDAILLMDDRGLFVDANPSAEILLGYPLHEIKALHFTDLTPPPTDLKAQALWSLFQTSGTQVGEFSVRRKDGRMIEIEYRAVRDIKRGIHLVMARDISERKIAEVNLRENQTRLEAVSRRLVHAQEDERGRIARELHDEVGETLTAVILGLGAMQRGQCGTHASQQISDTRATVERAIEQIRTMSLGLRPLMLDDLGLPATLRWFLDGQAQKSGMAMHFSSTLPVHRLCSDVETACFRIVQEATTNAIRHSGATDVWVSLHDEDDSVALSVRDNGIGFDSVTMLSGAGTRFALGLAGMQERVRLLGGAIRITSGHDQGTGIAVTLPFSRPPGIDS